MPRRGAPRGLMTIMASDSSIDNSGAVMMTYIIRIIIPATIDCFFDISKFLILLISDEKFENLFFLYKKAIASMTMLLETNKTALFPISNGRYRSVDIFPNS